MSKLSYWSQVNLSPFLSDVLDQPEGVPQLKYNKDNSLAILLETIMQNDIVSCATLINGTSMGVSIIIATKANEMFRVVAYRPVLGDFKNLNEWIDAFYKQKVYVYQIDNKYINI